MPVVTHPFFQRLHKGLSTLNDFLLIPMIASIILELSEYQSLFVQNAALMDYLMNLSFFLEWFLGFMMSPKRLAYMLDRQDLLDLVSCTLWSRHEVYQTFRLIRVIQIFRVLIRAKRYSGPVREIARMLFLVGTILCVGAYTMLWLSPKWSLRMDSLSPLLRRQCGGRLLPFQLWATEICTTSTFAEGVWLLSL